MSEQHLLDVAEDAAQALGKGRAVVALESTLITHGLPHPQNRDAALAAEAAVRDAGAIPATVAILDGRIKVGLREDQIASLAFGSGAEKVSRQNLAAALGQRGWSGTTVSATMIIAHLAGIRVFATGGIGGVHVGGHDTLDISADLAELARTPVVVVCAGPKAILDVPRTLEVLETHGVPVIGWRTDRLPGFFSVGSGIPVPSRVDTAEEAAALVARHHGLGLTSGVLINVPVPESAALPEEEARAVIAQATSEAAATGISGPATTPWILDRVAQLTDGRSTRANVALIEQNARVAAAIAIAMCGHRR